MEDVDFSTKLLRSDLELICEDVFNRIPGVVEQAVLAANIGIDELQQIIIIGGGTRIPKVQEKLLAAVKRCCYFRGDFLAHILITACFAGQNWAKI